MAEDTNKANGNGSAQAPLRLALFTSRKLIDSLKSVASTCDLVADRLASDEYGDYALAGVLELARDYAWHQADLAKNLLDEATEAAKGADGNASTEEGM